MSIRNCRLACLLILTAASLPVLAQTQLMKCRDADGRVTYSDRGCDTAIDVRELNVSRSGSVIVAPPRAAAGRSTAQAEHASVRAAGDAAPSAPRARAASSPPPYAGSPAAPRDSGAASEHRPAPEEGSAEREALQATRDDYRRDINRVRTEAAKASLAGAR